MSVTVAQMKQTNHHVMRLPGVMLKNENEEVTDTQKKVHAAVQGTLYAGIPASTIPSLVKNPQLFGASAGLGLTAGSIARVFSELVSPSTVSNVKNWADWLVHTAAMNTISKAVFGSIQASGITANTLLAYFKDYQIVIICEGGLVGGLAGYEAAGFVLDCIMHRQQSPRSSSSSEETQGPSGESAPLVNNAV